MSVPEPWGWGCPLLPLPLALPMPPGWCCWHHCGFWAIPCLHPELELLSAGCSCSLWGWIPVPQDLLGPTIMGCPLLCRMLRNNRISCIHNDSFTGLRNVRLLSLYDNQISTIAPGAFDTLQSLSTLYVHSGDANSPLLGVSGPDLKLCPPICRNLLANPFNCNCQLAWLGEWLRKRKIVTGNPRCQHPDFLRQIPLQDVAFPDFRCEEGNSHPPVPAPSLLPCSHLSPR